MILNGFAYAVLGIPPADLEKPWYDVSEISQQSNHSSSLLDQQIVATISQVILNVLELQIVQDLRSFQHFSYSRTHLPVIQRSRNLAESFS